MRRVSGTRIAGALMLSMMMGSLVPYGAAAQTGVSAEWVAPRASDGHPDLQGIWANNSITPLERPKELGERATLSDEELARIQARASELFGQEAGDAAFGDQFFQAAVANTESFTSSDGGTGNYNQFWLVEREFNNRTSLIVDPPDGRLPQTTQAAELATRRRAEGRNRPAEWTEDRGLSERCVTFGLPNLLAGYNSYYQILQTADHVAIVQELIHDTRIIPIGERPAVHEDIRQWHGVSRGYWEGDTLVVETVNFSPKSDFRGAREQLQLVERFTRVGPETLEYSFTVTDPTTWTRPWTAVVPWSLTHDPIFEYACHEGNIGMEGILAGARAEEARASARK